MAKKRKTMRKKNEDKAAAEEAVIEETTEERDGSSENESEEVSESAEQNPQDEKLLRLQAEFHNFKRRTERERTELGDFVRMQVVRDFLPIKDDFDRLMQHLEGDKEQLISGIKLIEEKLNAFLKRLNVSEIEALRNDFDPNLHEAMMMQPVASEEEANQVVQVLEKGYRLNERIIRHARVIVGEYKPES
jgi:molecular chaperone GrpE